jgi:D-aspartate ligase
MVPNAESRDVSPSGTGYVAVSVPAPVRLRGNGQRADDSRVSAARLPILLCDATFSGTLAAVRSLGRAGIPVVVAGSGPVAAAFLSRYTTRHVRCPPVEDAPAFLQWLLRFGEREGRHVLYPTSDEVVYLLAAHREELSKRFALYQPDLATMLGVLDKRKLYDAAGEAGLDAPRTWFPESSRDVERAAREAATPLMIKPRTQAFLQPHHKGEVGPRDPVLLREVYDRFCSESTYADPVASHMPELTRPMLQRFYPQAAESIYSVTGFRDITGRNLALLGAIKVLQRPRSIGIGLCFESAPLPEGLFQRVSRFLERIGYYGIFELEFVRDGDRLLLIDMNPRFYHQLALDVARGLDLPRLAYAAAIEDADEMAQLVTLAPTGEGAPYSFCNGIGLRVLVGAQKLFGTMSPVEAARWREWRHDARRTLVDSADADDDRAPFVAEVLGQVYGFLRHPRSFVRRIALDR